MEPGPATEAAREFFRSGYLLASALTLLVYLGVLAIAPTPLLEAPLGLYLLLFAPGYALASLLFPGRISLPWPVYFAFSAGLSVSFNILLGLVPLARHAGLPPALFASAAFLVSLVALAVRLQSEGHGVDRLRKTASGALGMSGFSRGQRGGAYGLLAATAIVLAVIVFLAASHPNVHPGIALALTGPDGTVAALPAGGPIGGVLSVWVTITNNATAQQLVLEVQSLNLSTVQTQFHVVPWTLPLRLANATQSSDAFNLQPDQTYTLNLTFQYSYGGTYSVSVYLADATGTTLRTSAFSVAIR
ncbi:MAG TPA: DUF1616 domain-containing protein [Thermoplasmata archaeon]|nr:DUF1616 domain-containing protein [Thermoplasmata archaeon]